MSSPLAQTGSAELICELSRAFLDGTRPGGPSRSNSTPQSLVSLLAPAKDPQRSKASVSCDPKAFPPRRAVPAAVNPAGLRRICSELFEGGEFPKVGGIGINNPKGALTHDPKNLKTTPNPIGNCVVALDLLAKLPGNGLFAPWLFGRSAYWQPSRQFEEQPAPMATLLRQVVERSRSVRLPGARRLVAAGQELHEAAKTSALGTATGRLPLFGLLCLAEPRAAQVPAGRLPGVRGCAAVSYRHLSRDSATYDSRACSEEGFTS